LLPKHKTAKYIGAKAIPLGIPEQKILSKYIVDNNQEPLFKNGKGRALSRAEYGRKIGRAIKKTGYRNLCRIKLGIRH
jgi:hypothetical protein